MRAGGSLRSRLFWCDSIYGGGRVRQRGNGNCSAMLHSDSHMLVWVGVSVKEWIVSFGVAERCDVHTCVGGCERQRGKVWWLRHGVATLDVRERTATSYAD